MNEEEQTKVHLGPAARSPFSRAGRSLENSRTILRTILGLGKADTGDTGDTGDTRGPGGPSGGPGGPSRGPEGPPRSPGRTFGPRGRVPQEPPQGRVLHLPVQHGGEGEVGS